MRRTVLFLWGIQDIPLATLEEAIKTVGLDLAQFTLVHHDNFTELGVDADVNLDHISMVMLRGFLTTLIKPTK